MTSTINFASVSEGTIRSPLYLVLNLVQLAMQNFLFVPFTIIFSYFIYLSLRKVKQEAPSESEIKTLKIRVWAFSVFGVAVLIGLLTLAAFLLWRFYPSLINGTSSILLQAIPSLAGLFPLFGLFKGGI